MLLDFYKDNFFLMCNLSFKKSLASQQGFSGLSEQEPLFSTVIYVEACRVAVRCFLWFLVS